MFGTAERFSEGGEEEYNLLKARLLLNSRTPLGPQAPRFFLSGAPLYYGGVDCPLPGGPMEE